ncbi:MAG TPA: DMT family transporter [Alphaproteobacteria bacterium]|nr:DMT family transporter [Alphaproteobacteria bacterium]
MALAPVLFASNILMARAVADLVPPVALAIGRWGIAALLLLPVAAKPLWRARRAVRRELFDLFVLGVLGMVVCGAVVYIGAQTTTATNIGLIYAASPVFIIVLARIFYGEVMSRMQALGVALCLVGVVTIIVRGEIGVLLGLTFTIGDLYILGCSFAWAVYTVLMRHRRSALGATPRFTALTIAGVAALLPLLFIEAAVVGTPRLDGFTLGVMLFLAIVPGLGAYQTYDFVQRRLGANRASLLMYLIPVYNAGLAWALLGEALRLYHFIGAAMVLPGIYLATRRASP